MPSTVTQTRPDEATGARHISEPANAIVARINATQHKNVVAMHDAIDGWVKEANRLGGEAGIEYLARCAARIEANRKNIADWCADRAPLWRSLIGVTVWDLEAAELRITRAARVLSGEGA